MTRLQSRAAAAGRWSAAGTAIGSGIQLVQWAVMAHLLPPSAFGAMAVVTVITGAFTVVGDFGLSSAVIQREDNTKLGLSSIYWVNVFLGTLLFCISTLLAPYVAAAISEPLLGELLAVAAIGVPVSAAAGQFSALAQRELDFRLVTSVELLGGVAGFVIAVLAAAVWDQGVWALVWSYLGNTGIRTAGLFAYAWKKGYLPTRRFRLEAAKPYLRYGSYLTGTMSINFLTGRADQLIVGVVLGTTALGYYSMAVNLVYQPTMKLNTLVTRVTFPVFSRVRTDTNRFQKGFVRVLRLVSSINSPALLGFAAIAPVLVPLLLGEQWQPTVPLVQIMCITALLRSFGALGGSVVMAGGKAEWLFYWNCGVVSVLPAMVYLVSQTGRIEYVAGSLAATQLLLVVGQYHLMVRRLLGRCGKAYLASVCAPSSLALLMAAGVSLLAASTAGIPELGRIPLLIGAGVLLYFGLYMFVLRDDMRESLRLILGR